MMVTRRSTERGMALEILIWAPDASWETRRKGRGEATEKGKKFHHARSNLTTKEEAHACTHTPGSG